MYCLPVVLGYYSVAPIFYTSRPIKSFRRLCYCFIALIVYPSQPIESFRLDRVMSVRFSRLLFRRPYCLPLLANRIFSAWPCFWQCVFLGYCSVAYFVLLKCSENRFNVTKISKRAIELIAFFFILFRATKDVSRVKSCSNKQDIGNEPETTKIFRLARRLITGWRIWLSSAWCCELNVIGISNNTIKGREVDYRCFRLLYD